MSKSHETQWERGAPEPHARFLVQPERLSGGWTWTLVLRSTSEWVGRDSPHCNTGRVTVQSRVTMAGLLSELRPCWAELVGEPDSD